MTVRRAVFLDRDGTVNEECGYLHRAEDCRFIPGSLKAIATLTRAGFLVVVVTNQSGIARGFYTQVELEKLHDYMQCQIETAGGRVAAWYHCPHHPEFQADSCDCRKPLPGMLLKAAADLEIDLHSSWMIGDKSADIEAGRAAGCRTILVRTGYGATEADADFADTTVLNNLEAAAEYITSMEA